MALALLSAAVAGAQASASWPQCRPPCSPAALAEPPTWINATSLTVGGKAFTDTANFWNRLPAAAKGVVQPPSVWGLSQQSAVRPPAPPHWAPVLLSTSVDRWSLLLTRLAAGCLTADRACQSPSLPTRLP